MSLAQWTEQPLTNTAKRFLCVWGRYYCFSLAAVNHRMRTNKWIGGRGSYKLWKIFRNTICFFVCLCVWLAQPILGQGRHSMWWWASNQPFLQLCLSLSKQALSSTKLSRWPLWKIFRSGWVKKRRVSKVQSGAHDERLKKKVGSGKERRGEGRGGEDKP